MILGVSELVYDVAYKYLCMNYYCRIFRVTHSSSGTDYSVFFFIYDSIIIFIYLFFSPKKKIIFTVPSNVHKQAFLRTLSRYIVLQCLVSPC